MLKNFVQRAARRAGYEIRKSSAHQPLGYDLEDEVEPFLARVRPYTMLSRTRLVTLYQHVAHCEKYAIQGAFVECGVWKGGSVALMALASMKLATSTRHLHLYDAFTEICEPDPAVDGKRSVQETKAYGGSGGVSGKLVPLTGVYDSQGGPGTLEGNRELLEQHVGYNKDFLHFHKGWFQDTLPETSGSLGPIALLRLDGDWYASTKVCLEHLYSLVVPGGFIVVDDYGAYDGCRRAVDEFRAANGITSYLHHVDAECRYWIKST